MSYRKSISIIICAGLIVFTFTAVFADVTVPGQAPRQAVSWHDPTPCAGLVFQCNTTLRAGIDTCGQYVDSPLYRLIGREEEAYWAGRREYTYCREKFTYAFEKEFILAQTYIIPPLTLVGVAAFGFFLYRILKRRKR